MKKLFVIPVILLYLLAVSGVMIHLHYCGQSLQDWSVYTKSNGCCESDCGEEEKDGCCDNKIITNRISEDQQHAEVQQLKVPFFAAGFTFTQTVFIFNTASLPTSSFPHSYQANAPPGLWESIPLYKLHSRFTFYG